MSGLRIVVLAALAAVGCSSTHDGELGSTMVEPDGGESEGSIGGQAGRSGSAPAVAGSSGGPEHAGVGAGRGGSTGAAGDAMGGAPALLDAGPGDELDAAAALDSGEQSDAGSAVTTCPLGTTDADGSGFADACETVLWSQDIDVTFDTDEAVGLFAALRQDTPGCEPFRAGDDGAALYGEASTTIYEAQAEALTACADLTAPKLDPVQLTVMVRGVRPGATGGFAFISMARYAEEQPQEVFSLTDRTVLYLRRDVVSYDRTTPSNHFVGRWSIVGY